MLQQENDDKRLVERTDDVYWGSILPPRATTSRRQSYYPSGTYPEAKSDLSSMSSDSLTCQIYHIN